MKCLESDLFSTSCLLQTFVSISFVVQVPGFVSEDLVGCRNTRKRPVSRERYERPRVQEPHSQQPLLRQVSTPVTLFLPRVSSHMLPILQVSLHSRDFVLSVNAKQHPQKCPTDLTHCPNRRCLLILPSLMHILTLMSILQVGQKFGSLRGRNVQGCRHDG